MKITVLQTDIVRASPKENVERISQAVADLPPTDLILLPEMFTTGFVMEPQGCAEEENGIGPQWMEATARARNCAVAGSIAVRQNGRYFNRFYFVKPDGDITYCDKHHLFTYSGEDKRFTAGDRRIVAEFRGVRFLLLVCYDLRFPVWSRNTGDYDAILYVASWPEPRTYVWRTLLRARAIENQCWVIGANRVGDDEGGHYVGASVIIDHLGHTVAECRDDAEDSVSADIDMAAVKAFKEKFPAWRDADEFVIK